MPETVTHPPNPTPATDAPIRASGQSGETPIATEPSLKGNRPLLPLPLFLHPAFWFSIALHGIFLVLPISEESVTSTEEAPEPAEAIALADLLAPAEVGDRPPAALPSPTSASPSPVEEAIVQLPVQPPAPPVSPQPSPSPPLSPEASPTPSPEAAPVEVEEAIASPTPTPEASPDPPLEELPDQVQTFFEELAAATGAPVNPPSPDLFAEPSLFFEANNPEATLKPDILRAVWMEGKTPQQVYISVLNSQLQDGNFQAVQKNDYGSGTVYEVRQGEATWYLNLVPTLDGSGTIIVVWNRDPSRSVLPSTSRTQITNPSIFYRWLRVS